MGSAPQRPSHVARRTSHVAPGAGRARLLLATSDMLPHPLWIALDEFLAGELPLDELGSRLSLISDLEAVIGANDARELRELDYSGISGVVDAMTFAERLYERHRPGAFARDRATRLARGMVDGSINAAAGTRALARLSREGHHWIPDAFGPLADALDGSTPGERRGWEPGALGARLTQERERARELRAPAILAARRLLETLEREFDHGS